ncbi:Protein CBG18492 [Caenorhabditis briggsae]|uniref:Protein CBG18492 n=1 Tax=Caenorhabditis briggsae TaxID=6238 RepID=A8XTF6_CAEBR|nr:Protein CBG18492 [Caenorhabditis briggsae]CAP35933.2 Protein CBG18492 [Caenorhabditis briggsae]
MAHNLLLITLAVSALATVTLAGPGGRGGPKGGPHGHGHGGPSYLANVTKEGRREFEAVFKNETATIAEIDAQTSALAEKYNDAYNAFTAKHTAHLAAVKANQTQVISNLETVVPKLAAIYQNKDQTRKAQEEAVDALRQEYPVEVAAVKYIRELLGAHDKQRPGPRGGPRGGPHRGGHGHGRHGFY